MKSIDELEAMIKQKGYWTVNIHPLKYKEKLIPINSDLFTQYLNRCRVTLRGWSYPVIPFNSENHANIENGVIVLNEEYLPEIWKFSTSGNFYQIFGFREDYHKEVEEPLLGYFSTLYSFTEIFLFAKKLFSLEEFSEEDVYIEIQLHGLKDRELYVDLHGISPFSGPKISKIYDDKKILKEITKGELMLKSEQLAMEALGELIRLFEFTPNLEIYKQDQENFLKGWAL